VINFLFIYRFISKEFINTLLDKTLTDPTSSLVTNGLNVILSLLDYQKHIRITTYQFDGKALGPEICAKKEAEHSIRFFDCVHNAHEAILSRLHLLKNLLINPIETKPIESTIGLIEQPFGVTRLKILAVLRALLIVNNPKVNTAIKDHQIFPLLMVKSRPINICLRIHLNSLFFEKLSGTVFQVPMEQLFAQFRGAKNSNYFA
jgi:hypothetical protein